MTSLRQSLNAGGLSGPFSLRTSFETHPRTLSEVIRVLRLAPMHLDPESYEELWEKTEPDAQGSACIELDASAGPVEIGDLLTTSSMRGHAMCASDRDRSFGAVLGKALAPLENGQGLVPILVSLL